MISPHQLAPLALRDREGRHYVGPDNGLLLPAARRAGIAAAHELAAPRHLPVCQVDDHVAAADQRRA